MTEQDKKVLEKIKEWFDNSYYDYETDEFVFEPTPEQLWLQLEELMESEGC